MDAQRFFSREPITPVPAAFPKRLPVRIFVSLPSLIFDQGGQPCSPAAAALTALHRCEENMRAEAIRRRLRDGDSDIESEAEGSQNGLDEEGRQADEDCYIVPSTNARVTRSSAKGLLFHYCSKLPSDK